MAKQLPRGIRNNNPGNIESNPRNKWQGLTPIQPDPRFATFSSAAFGIRALAVLLVNYYDKHDLDTVAGVINRWAPSVENNTGAYITAVARAFKPRAVDPRQTRLNLQRYEDLEPIVRAIINHENGDPREHGRKVWYGQDVIDEGLRRAGVVKRGPQTAAVKQPETQVAAGVAAGTAATAGGGVYVAMQVHETVQAMNQAGRAKIEAGEAQQGLLFLGGGLAILVASAVALAYIAWRKSRIRREE